MDMSPWERRQKILETLCLRRHETTGNLTHEFNVSQGTIRRDIVVLDYFYAHSTGVFTDQAKALGVDDVWNSDYTWTMNSWTQAVVWRYKAGLLSDPVVACAEELLCVYNNLEHTNYVCAKYKSGRGTCSAHYIREDVLRDVVLERIRAVTEYIWADVEGFQEIWLMCQREEQEKSIREDKRRLEKAKKRLTDIDKLITRIYEDMVLGNLSQERYQKMLEGYEAEQAALNNEVIGLEDWVATREEMEDNVDQFLALLEKYVDIPELTTTIVNEFIKQIIVYAPDKSSGKRTQMVKIVFNFLEEVEVPVISESAITKTTYGRRKTA